MDWFRPKEKTPEEKIDKEKFELLKQKIKYTVKPTDKALLLQDSLTFKQKYGWTGGKTSRKKKKSRRNSLKKRK